MSGALLVYGANGYTGRLIVAECLARGVRPILSGRSAAAINGMAATSGLESRPVALDDPRALAETLRGVGAVLHCAGPFIHTAGPMLEACLANRVHYLDITGEIAVFEQVAALHERAESAGVTLLPGVGFDVVPTDCLAAHLKRRLPSATSLTLAFSGGTPPSQGTALTVIEGLGSGGAIRRDGRITGVPVAWRTRVVDFGVRERLCVTIPWGDVSTAFYSTRIPNIETYMATSAQSVRLLRLSRYLGPVLASGPVKRLLAARVKKGPAGPSPEALASRQSHVWGEVRDGAGLSARSRLTAPNGYALTALSSVRAAVRVLGGGAPAGFLTPSMAFGADFVLEIPGTTREDIA
ncbi:MAG: saccharopine dehydrogenase family protein [Gemmatimonadaceae bacterium]